MKKRLVILVGICIFTLLLLLLSMLVPPTSIIETPADVVYDPVEYDDYEKSDSSEVSVVERASHVRPVSGRVLGAKLDSVVGVTVRLEPQNTQDKHAHSEGGQGESAWGATESISTDTADFALGKVGRSTTLEEVVTDANGEFRFGEADHARLMTLVCARGGKEIARWSDVVVGAGAETQGGNRLESPPAAPDSVDFTIALLETPTHSHERTHEEEGGWIRVDRVLVESWGDVGRIRCKGSTSLPNGAHVYVSLYFDGLRDVPAFDPGEVKDGCFEVVLWAAGARKLYSGLYSLHLAFNAAMERYDDLTAWHEEYPNLSLDPMSFDAPIWIGDRRRSREEDARVQVYYRRAVAQARRWRTDLLARIRELRLASKGWSPEVLKLRGDFYSGWFQEDVIEPDGRFAEARWRDFLDNQLRPQLRKALELHQARGPQKYQEAEGRVSDLYNALSLQTYAYSRFVVYPMFGRQPHASDFYLDEGQGGDVGVLERRVRENLQNLQRFCELVEE